MAPFIRPLKSGEFSLCVVFSLAYLPFWDVLPFWVSISVMAAIFCRLFGAPSLALPLRNILYNLGALFFFALVLAEFGSVIDKLSGSALLALMIALKLMEARKEKDLWEVLALSFILLGAASFFKTDIKWGLYFCLSLFAFIVAQGSVAPHRQAFQAKKDLLIAPLRALLLGIPVAALLFVSYPRLKGGIIALSASEATGETGISPIVAPGTIARLIPLRRIDFRVFFGDSCGYAPPYYWRVFTLDTFKNGAWVKSIKDENGLRHVGAMAPNGLAECTYRVEPVQEMNVLIALDWPVRVLDGPVRLVEDLTAQTKKGHRGSSYSLISQRPFPKHQERLGSSEYLGLPNGGNPRTRALARRLCKDIQSPQDVIKKIQDYFLSEDFQYSLNPGVLKGRDTIDEFLFESQRGFCEHYASATAFILRLCKIPSRVVVGYLGGTLNPLGDYLVVRSSAAHAWVEAYYQGRWHTIDPTTFVSSSRASYPEAIGYGPDQGVFSIGISGVFRRGLDLVSLGIDALNHYWNVNVMGFDKVRQIQLWNKIGLYKGGMGGHGFFFLIPICILIVLGLLYFILFNLLDPSAHAGHVEEHYYRLFIAILKREGLEIECWHGPLKVMDLISQLEPWKKKEASTFLIHYVEAVYGLGGIGENRVLMRSSIGRLVEMTLFQ